MSDIVVANDTDFRQLVADRELADYVGLTLITAYPGYRWRVEPHAHPTKPFVDVRCEHAASRENYGFTLQPWRFYSASAWKAAILKAGGEILERFHLNRRALDPVEFLTAPRTFTGLMRPDL